ncbi:hypothetical protein [Acidovorax sp. NCPPB 3576]|uniref:hypothetical protein n=1 Tax=Acidovorax sp. NCPPB 3576 TaxID=2940488 RepID=UPI002349A337|nr:hypothetical protein [Acidovorax sp. NCPPB 3576]WCM88657.1 hypothetical protein M5C98_00930 [Acidovorax sp. NCPPB 3576]
MPTIERIIPASLALAFALAAALPATAAAPPVQTVSAPQRAPYPAIDPAFSRPDARRMPSRATLRAFLTEMKSYRQANTFCFVQRKLDRPDTAEPGTSVLSMIWYEGESIHRINRLRVGQSYVLGTMDPETEGRMLAHATGTVDIKTDVVPTDADIGTSTFLVSRPWVDHMFAQCKRVGAQVRIPVFKPPAPSQ